MLRKLSVAIALTTTLGIGITATPASADGLNRCLRRVDRGLNHDINRLGGQDGRALARDQRQACRDRHLH